MFGKVGRAETATDPAPLEMFETTIQFKPREQWRAGMTPDKLVEELDRIVRVPGLTNIWVPPIRNRIDMLATGIKSPVGVKVAGTNLQEIDRIAAEIERAVSGAGRDLCIRRTPDRRALHRVDIDRDGAARYGLNIADVQSIVSAAVGGDNVGETVEGLQRFHQRALPARDARLRGEAADCRYSPSAARRSAWAMWPTIRISRWPTDAQERKRAAVGLGLHRSHGRDLSSAVRDMQQVVAREFGCRRATPSPGRASSSTWSAHPRSSSWSCRRRSLIIFVLLYLRSAASVRRLLIMATLPSHGRRLLADLSAGLQHVGRLGRRLHRPRPAWRPRSASSCSST